MVFSCAAGVSAQSTFVSGSLMGEIARFGRIESETRLDPVFDSSLDGESIGFSLSAERMLGERWGVMLEFARPGEIDRSSTYSPPVIAIYPPVPIIVLTRDVEFRNDSLNVMATFSQPAGDRLELGFLAGVSFTRGEWTTSYRYDPTVLVRVPPDELSLAVPALTAVQYGVGPIVGFDARIRFTDRFAIVPGIRLQSASVADQPGWLVRPAVAARFGF
jgi:hypothetical protein